MKKFLLVNFDHSTHRWPLENIFWRNVYEYLVVYRIYPIEQNLLELVIFVHGNEFEVNNEIINCDLCRNCT